MPNEEYLDGVAPSNVSRNNEDLMDHLQMENQEFTQHNKKNSEKRAAKLEEAGGFRAMESTEENSQEVLSQDLKRPCGKWVQ